MALTEPTVLASQQLQPQLEVINGIDLTGKTAIITDGDGACAWK